MHILSYGTKQDHDTCVQYINSAPELQYRRIDYTHTDNYDAFIENLHHHHPKFDVVLVMANGAEGMEGVRATRHLCPDQTVVWLSDDEGFGAQSYRYGCTYFGVKPITRNLIAEAIRKYQEKHAR